MTACQREATFRYISASVKNHELSHFYHKTEHSKKSSNLLHLVKEIPVFSNVLSVSSSSSSLFCSCSEDVVVLCLMERLVGDWHAANTVTSQDAHSC